jgi:hypothetical protein
MSEYEATSSLPQNDRSFLPWYYKRRTILIGFLLGIWPGLLLLALRPPRSKKKSLIITGVVIGGLIVSSLSGSGSHNATTRHDVHTSTSTTTLLPNVSYKDFLIPGVDVNRAWTPLCKEAAAIIRNKTSNYDALLASGNKASADPYAAQGLIQKVQWWNGFFEIANDAQNQVVKIPLRVVPTFLNEAGIKAANGSDSTSFAQQIGQDFITVCQLGSTLENAHTKGLSLESLRISLQTSAKNLPWYPKGYSEFETGLAYRWLSSGQFSCSYSSGSCWGMSVRSQSGCTSLYVEITILDSQGNNIGYTNDTTSGLQVGQSAKMVFDSFEDNASKARLAKIDCY